MPVDSRHIQLEKYLDTKLLARQVIWFNELSSTQTYLKELLHSGKKLKESVLVIADRQTDGYGRYRRKWFSPPGGAWMSLFVRADISPEKAGELTTVVAVSTAKTLESYILHKSNAGIHTDIKEPNDILIKNKKVAGCLVETSICGNRLEWAVMGIGINANNVIPVEIRDVSISLREIIKKKIDLIDLISLIINNLDRDFCVYIKKHGFK